MQDPHLLHVPDASERSPAGPVANRLPAVRQGSLRSANQRSPDPAKIESLIHRVWKSTSTLETKVTGLPSSSAGLNIHFLTASMAGATSNRSPLSASIAFTFPSRPMVTQRTTLPC